MGAAWSTCSEVMHSLNGVAVSASLVARADRCTAEFHPRGESRRKDVMACDQAFAWQRIAGETKVRVAKRTFVAIRFPLHGGGEREVWLEQAKLQAGAVPVGGQVEAIYDPRDPNDVRGAFLWQRMQGNLLAVAGGLLVLLLLFFGPVRRLFAAASAVAAGPGNNLLRLHS
jgi:hypothetical protein